MRKLNEMQDKLISQESEHEMGLIQMDAHMLQDINNPPSDRIYNMPPNRGKADFKKEIDEFLDEELNGSSDDSGSSDDQMGQPV